MVTEVWLSVLLNTGLFSGVFSLSWRTDKRHQAQNHDAPPLTLLPLGGSLLGPADLPPTDDEGYEPLFRHYSRSPGSVNGPVGVAGVV
jgi:hypothetical protein